jgi:hypothetical protein
MPLLELLYRALTSPDLDALDRERAIPVAAEFAELDLGAEQARQLSLGITAQPGREQARAEHVGQRQEQAECREDPESDA